MRFIRRHTENLGGQPRCTSIGGGATAPDRAAFHHGALVRYRDFNDSCLARGETCHPSDTLSDVLAHAEYAQCGGRERQIVQLEWLRSGLCGTKSLCGRVLTQKV